MLSIPRVVWIMMCFVVGSWLTLSASIQAIVHASMPDTHTSALLSLHASHQDMTSVSQVPFSAMPMSDVNLASNFHDHTKNMNYADCVDHCTLAALPPILLVLASTAVYWPALSLIEKWRHHFLELVTPPPRLSTLIAS
ncbi:hypothetical protein [Marinomonas shanghaiensis]|uniref:hypothetical protein n=1 Tax=Marinomonas shanghaiensis TaxID=2202418 RepID=UPI003A94D216